MVLTLQGVLCEVLSQQVEVTPEMRETARLAAARCRAESDAEKERNKKFMFRLYRQREENEVNLKELARLQGLSQVSDAFYLHGGESQASGPPEEQKQAMPQLAIKLEESPKTFPESSHSDVQPETTLSQLYIREYAGFMKGNGTLSQIVRGMDGLTLTS